MERKYDGIYTRLTSKEVFSKTYSIYLETFAYIIYFVEQKQNKWVCKANFISGKCVRNFLFCNEKK